LCSHFFVHFYRHKRGTTKIILNVLGNNNIMQCFVGVVSTHLFNDILVTWPLWSLGFGYNSALGIAQLTNLMLLYSFCEFNV